ncbi:MAG: hypothetical protein ACXABY_27590 [Candidatus Thorarchaeota archaeon]|jgi:hypothetical protein
MRITFDIDFSDLETMSRENLFNFLGEQLLSHPLMDLCDEIAKPDSAHLNQACKEASMRICKDNIEVGRRLMASIKIDE